MEEEFREEWKRTVTKLMVLMLSAGIQELHEAQEDLKKKKLTDCENHVGRAISNLNGIMDLIRIYVRLR